MSSLTSGRFYTQSQGGACPASVLPMSLLRPQSHSRTCPAHVPLKAAEPGKNLRLLSYQVARMMSGQPSCNLHVVIPGSDAGDSRAQIKPGAPIVVWNTVVPEALGFRNLLKIGLSPSMHICKASVGI